MLSIDCEKYLATCPMCNGKGYCERNKSASKSTRSAILLPPVQLHDKNVPPNGINDVPCVKAAGDIVLPSLSNSTSTSKRNNFTPIAYDYSPTLEQDFLGTLEKFDNPQEILKLSLLNLKENQWNSNICALKNIVQISRFQPELLDSSMPIINRSLCSALKNTRSLVVRTACQISKELFKTVQCTQRPEFDELVSALLQKTAHMNKAIRQDANKALDVMIVYVSLFHCVKVIVTSCGVGHKNPLVRNTVSRLLHNIISTTGINSLLSTNMKDIRRKISGMSAKLMTDGHSETRNNAKKIIKLLMSHDDFESWFQQDIDRKLFEKIEKQLVTLRYES